MEFEKWAQENRTAVVMVAREPAYAGTRKEELIGADPFMRNLLNRFAIRNSKHELLQFGHGKEYRYYKAARSRIDVVICLRGIRFHADTFSVMEHSEYA